MPPWELKNIYNVVDILSEVCRHLLVLVNPSWRSKKNLQHISMCGFGFIGNGQTTLTTLSFFLLIFAVNKILCEGTRRRTPECLTG
jgi:hypothetical protein